MYKIFSSILLLYIFHQQFLLCFFILIYKRIISMIGWQFLKSHFINYLPIVKKKSEKEKKLSHHRCPTTATVRLTHTP